MKYFISLGKDGYETFEKCPYLIEEEQGEILLPALKQTNRAIVFEFKWGDNCK